MFQEGDMVVCINDKEFIAIMTTNENRSVIGTHSKLHPKKGEVLAVDEVLGEYIRFDLYDGYDTNWFYEKYFVLLNPLLETIRESEFVLTNQDQHESEVKGWS